VKETTTMLVVVVVVVMVNVTIINHKVPPHVML
jgi:hypothetical protein